ncbi:MAG TPA: DedA family protein [Jatrophihabitantaceae bacterium]|nr:DedA family protein [Jatrophihabitantaceae bacterium]
MFETLMHHIGDAVGSWLYLIAGGLAFAEAAILVGFVLPGEIALLVAGYFCRYGPLNVWIMAAIAVVCAIVGDTVGFEFGRYFGPPIRRSRLGQWIGEPRWAKVDGFLHRHGGKAVFLGRLTALLRALMPSMAGMSGMRYRTFLAWNAAGGLLWGAGCVFLGYAFASALNTVSRYLTWLPIALIAVIAAGYLAVHLRKRRQERDEEQAFAEAGAGPDEA